MIPVKHIDPDDLPLYAMQLLSPDEMREMSDNLQHSGEARRVLSEVYGDLTIFALSSEMQSPSASAKQRLMKQVARENKVVPINAASAGGFAPRAESPLLEQEPARKSVATKVLPWVGWAIAAGMILPILNFHHQRDELQRDIAVNDAQLQRTQISAELANTLMATVKDPSAVHVLLTGSDQKPPPEGRASYVPDKGSLVFLASNLEPIKDDQTYELWLIPANGGSPIPAGTFRPDARGNASVVLPPLPRGVAAKAFGVTVENSGGSATPTAPILLKGAAS